MGIVAIKVPDIGEGVTEVEIVEWALSPGDSVNEDDVVGSVMTDKAAVEIPSPASGVIKELAADIGDVVAVGSVIVRIEVDGEGDGPETADSPAIVQTPSVVEQSDVVDDGLATLPITPLEPIETHADAPITPNRMRQSSRRALASPAVRQRARDAGIDLNQVSGSGQGGRIVQDDLQSFIDGTSHQASRGGRIPNTHIEEIKIVGVRRQIARRMQLAKQRVPHFSYVEEVDVTWLEELRGELNGKRREDQPKLTVLPFIIKALTRAVEQFPQMNARFDDDNELVRRYGGVHVGIATQTPHGLMVPVLRHAESLDIWETSAEIRRIAQAARDGTAKRDELSGSTITITSLGPLGGIVTTPVINYPEVAILGVNKIATRPVWQDDSVVPRQMMNLSSSFDHRVVDGMDSAEFIQRIRSMLEHPTLMFMEEA